MRGRRAECKQVTESCDPVGKVGVLLIGLDESVNFHDRPIFHLQRDHVVRTVKQHPGPHDCIKIRLLMVETARGRAVGEELHFERPGIQQLGISLFAPNRAHVLLQDARKIPRGHFPVACWQPRLQPHTLCEDTIGKGFVEQFVS